MRTSKKWTHSRHQLQFNFAAIQPVVGLFPRTAEGLDEAFYRYVDLKAMPTFEWRRVRR